MRRSAALKLFAPVAGAHDQEPNAVESRLAGGIRVATDVAYTAHGAAHALGTDLYALIEVLIAKGVVHIKEFEDRKALIAEQLQPSETKTEMSWEPDKYAIPPERLVRVDCDERYHLCRGACCRLVFGLSAQDLDEGIVRWEYDKPYRIRHRASDDRCVHQDPVTLGCTVYEHRPAICRTYSCADDKRIWLDFANMIPNPDLAR